MSALQRSPASERQRGGAALPGHGLRLRPMAAADLDAVIEIEHAAYGFPWTRGNFIDSLAAGHRGELLVQADGSVIGYCLAMRGVDEMHLLNLTVAPRHQRQGHACRLLDALERHCRALGIGRIWLEVRTSNAGARRLYLRRGFVETGLRRGYYPAGAAGREDALVMQLELPAGRSDAPSDALDR